MKFDLQPLLSGELISLRPLEESDRADLFAIASDPLIWDQHPQKNRYQRPVFDVFFDNALQSQGALIVSDAKTKKVIGSSRFYEWNPDDSSVAIGYSFLARECWGSGYNREMKTLMLGHAFLFVEKVFLYVGESNIRSIKAIEKIGARLVGKTEKKNPDGSIIPSVIFEMKKYRA
jgi:RimJ/RimL family protein N-acetyltransferase